MYKEEDQLGTLKKMTEKIVDESNEKGDQE